MTETHQQRSTVGAYSLAVLARYPDRTAFRWDCGTLSYAATRDVIGRLQRVYDELGLRRGDRVAVLSGNRVESWCAATAAHASALSVTYLHPVGSLDDHVDQLLDSESAALVVDTRLFADRAAALADRVPELRVVLGMDPSNLGPDVWSEVERVGASPAHDRGHWDEVVRLNYTGGTTGKPKGVIYKHAAMLGHTISTLTDFELPSTPYYLAAAPITHVAGTKLLPVLARGGCVYLMDGFDSGQLLNRVAAERINMLLLVPTMVYALLDDPALDRTDLSSLELLLYGASSMSPHRLVEGLERIGPVFAQLYGQSECYPISYLPRAEHRADNLERLASCGFPVVGTQVALLDDEDQPVAPGHAGEICVRSASVMQEYWRLPELTAAALSNGWLHTGDVARADEEGYLYIVDRKKDMIVTGGFNVFPREVEDVLTGHPAVSAAAVFGVPHERWGEAVHAAVVLRPGSGVTTESLLALVRERKGPIQTPKRLDVLTEMPMTPVGKIDKVSLRGR